jgi:hypothetical protein
MSLKKMRQFIERTVDGRWLPKVLFPSDPNKRLVLKIFLKDRQRTARLFSSWMENAPLNATATRLLNNILRQRVLIYPKPVELIETLARQAMDNQADVILDFFAGSGTTGHAVINLNREDLSSGQAGGETRERTVDLPETFNYLLGLDVRTRRVYNDAGQHYLVYRGALRNGRTVAVIWRDTKDWIEEDYRRHRDFVKEQKLADGAGKIYTNGDSYIPGARSLDALFKARMFAPVEA